VKAAIAAIPGQAWTAIKYPQAIWDDQLGCWASDAEIAQTADTAFASKKDQAVTARLIVRRVRDQNHEAAGQGEFLVSRYHLAHRLARRHPRPPPYPTASNQARHPRPGHNPDLNVTNDSCY
jgi:hypothetical protein